MSARDRQRLLDALDLRVPGHARHSELVASTACHLADALSLDPQRRRLAYLAGRYHDVGKLGLPLRILHAPEPRSAADERRFRAHAECGAAMVRPGVDGLELSAAIRHQQEWVDGTGYPDGLKGAQIPLLARIVAVADARALLVQACATPAVVLHTLRARADTQLDCILVELLPSSARIDPPPAPREVAVQHGAGGA